MHLKEKLISAFDQSLDQLSFQQRRKESMERLKQDGFPTIRNEEWKYTNLQPLLKKEFELQASISSITLEEINEYILKDTDTYLMVFLNGVFQPNLSSISCQKAHISTIKNANEEQQKIIEKYWGSCLPKKGETFVDLNTAFADDGAFIRVKNNQTVDKPIEVLYLTTEENGPSFSQVRNLIIVEQNAEVQIVERHQNLGSTVNFTNFVSEVFAAQDSRVSYYKVQNDVTHASLVDNTHVMQERQSNVHVGTYSFGGKLIRNNLHFYSAGEHCESHMDGVTIIGDGQTVDHHTLVDHQEPHCYSRELYKGIYLGKSHGIFNGKVIVRQKAQKTNAFQQNDNILLSDKAHIDAKPQLEIFADDVRCSHGCTIGQLDKNALFYLRSRGIPKSEAQGLMTYAFASDALEYVKIPQLATRLNRVIAEKLGINLEFAL